VINAIKFSIEEIEASDQYFDHTPFIRVTLVVISIAPAARFLFQHYTFFRL